MNFTQTQFKFSVKELANKYKKDQNVQNFFDIINVDNEPVISDKFSVILTESDTAFPIVNIGFVLPTEILRKYPDGILHLYEHLLFHLHKDDTESELAKKFNAVFADQNAFTDANKLSVVSEVPEENLLPVLHLVYDMVMYPNIDKIIDFMDKEKKIVSEEISLTCTDPWRHFMSTLPDLIELGFGNILGQYNDIENISLKHLHGLHADIVAAGQFFIACTGRKTALNTVKLFTAFKTICKLDTLDLDYTKINETYNELTPYLNVLSYKFKDVAPKQIVTDFQPRPFQFNEEYFKDTRNDIIREIDKDLNRISFLDPNAPKQYVIARLFMYDLNEELIQPALQSQDFAKYIRDNWIPISPVTDALGGMGSDFFKKIRVESELAYSANIIAYTRFNTLIIIMYTDTSNINHTRRIFEIYDEVLNNAANEYSEEQHAITCQKLYYDSIRKQESPGSLLRLDMGVLFGELNESIMAPFTNYSREDILKQFKKITSPDATWFDVIIGGIDNSEEE